MTELVIAICLYAGFVLAWCYVHRKHEPPRKWKHLGTHPFKFEHGKDPNAHHSNYDSSGSGHYR